MHFFLKNFFGVSYLVGDEEIERKVRLKKKKRQAYASLLYLYSKLELGTTGVIDLYLVSVESLTGRLFMIILASSSLH